jgi:RimJ/RimL family protein N-acetyltransferase
MPETERLILRRPTVADADAFAAINADPEVARFVNAGGPMTRAETELLLRRMADHWADFGFGLWMADLKETGELAGFVGLQHPMSLPAVADEVEVGWRLGRRFWGHGYATEAGAAAVRHAFEERGLPRLISIIDPANVRSVAVARRLEFAHEREVEHPTWPVPVSIYARGRGGA